jgi:anti-sigma factor RsiW
MACSNYIQVHRYHDGELPPPDRQAAEVHLRDCPDCRRLLAELRRLSSLISAASPADMPTGLLGRLQECQHAVEDRGILRIAGWMTATAAAVLIGALLSRPADRTEAAALPAVWETSAVMPPGEVREGVNSDLATVAEWMVDDLSSGEKR